MADYVSGVLIRYKFQVTIVLKQNMEIENFTQPLCRDSDCCQVFVSFYLVMWATPNCEFEETSRARVAPSLGCGNNGELGDK